MIKSITQMGEPLMQGLSSFFEAVPDFSHTFTTFARWIFVLLALYILLRAILSLLATKTPSEIWAYLSVGDALSLPITHWENVIGRAKSCDLNIDIKTVSRNHATLIRDEDGCWIFNDLNSKSGSKVNGKLISRPTYVNVGDVLTVGNVDCTIASTSLEEDRHNKKVRSILSGKFTPWKSLIALSIFQFLLVIQLIISKGSQLPFTVPLVFLMYSGLMWLYSIVVRSIGMLSFEIESIAFFLSTLGLAVVSTSVPEEIFKQFATICIGMGLFFFLCWYLRDLNRTLKIRKPLLIFSVLLLILNIVIGTYKYGAINWISLGGFSIQPSELIKVAYIIIGSATLDELFQKKNLGLFIGFSLFCLLILAYMGDFGTAAIFFITFLVISFMRSGDFSKLLLFVVASAGAGLMVLRFKPYVLSRFAVWMHAWDFADAGGYQQVRTMSAGASGGLIGLGAGEGWLKNIAAADTDLVFGVLSEEWGLIIALLAILSIFTFSIFAVKSIKAGRSTYYTIAACAAMTLFTFQTILNVFGSVDLLPLTGVTFPFVSNGGTSIIVSWGLLAFLKAADTRANASIAVKRFNLKGEDE